MSIRGWILAGTISGVGLFLMLLEFEGQLTSALYKWVLIFPLGLMAAYFQSKSWKMFFEEKAKSPEQFQTSTFRFFLSVIIGALIFLIILIGLFSL